MFLSQKMKHLTLSLVVCLFMLALACQRPDQVDLQPTIEEPKSLPSSVLVGDATRANQLLKGFYELQANSWRWAAPNFSVVLGTPPSALKRGATLVLDFSVPDASIQALKSITLAARIGDLTLPPETITMEGTHQYRREVPPSAFSNDIVSVDFTVDKFLKPPGDGRDLAVVVTAVALESK
jgi:hypothetical protein